MVVGLFLAEAGVFGVAGGVLGGSLGLVLGNVLVGLVGRTIQDLYVPMADAPRTFGFPPGSVRLLTEAIVIGSGVSILGALGPSLDAGRTMVVAALAPGEYDVAQRVRAASLGVVGGGLLLFALGCALAGPVGGVPVFGYLATFCLLAGLSCLVPILMQWVCRTRELGAASASPSCRMERQISGYQRDRPPLQFDAYIAVRIDRRHMRGPGQTGSPGTREGLARRPTANHMRPPGRSHDEIGHDRLIDPHLDRVAKTPNHHHDPDHNRDPDEKGRDGHCIPADSPRRCCVGGPVQGPDPWMVKRWHRVAQTAKWWCPRRWRPIHDPLQGPTSIVH